MAKQVINFGSGYNDETSGDTDGVAWEKVILNFNELYGSAQKIATNNVDFSNPRGAFVGGPTDVKTGNFTMVDAGKEDGATALCFHEGGKPGLENGTIAGELGNYVNGAVNLVSIVVFNKTTNLYLLIFGGEVKNINGGGLNLPNPATNLSLTEGDFTPALPNTVTNLTLTEGDF